MKKNVYGIGLVASSLLVALSGCGSENMDPETNISSNRPEVSWEEFRSSVYQEPESGVFIVNGDEPIDSQAELFEFYNKLYENGELIVHQSGGVDAAWSPSDAVNLRYCVSTTFGSNYGRVVQAMNDAAGAWEATANIDFIHDSSKDGRCNKRTGGVTFDVNPVSSGQYLARAFFPNDGRRTRNILIDSSTYYYDDLDPNDPNYTPLAGILRHELGHALGFRHEHTRPEAGTCYEDSNWRPLTPYDSSSVMHYPQCNGTNTWLLELTETDRAGAEALYGAPGTCVPSAEICDDGVDNDCDGLVDSDDVDDCSGGPGPQCFPSGTSCASGSECCSGQCKGKRGSRSCR